MQEFATAWAVTAVVQVPQLSPKQLAWAASQSALLEQPTEWSSEHSAQWQVPPSQTVGLASAAVIVWVPSLKVRPSLRPVPEMFASADGWQSKLTVPLAAPKSGATALASQGSPLRRPPLQWPWRLPSLGVVSPSQVGHGRVMLSPRWMTAAVRVPTSYSPTS